MLEKFRSALQELTLTKAAHIINWVCFTPILIAMIWGWITDDDTMIYHPFTLLAFAILGFAYATLLSMDSSHELFFRQPLFDGVPRWLWRWICAGWGALMLVILFFVYIVPF